MGRKKNKSTSIQTLPIFKYKSEILEKIKNHQVVIITGQTGCGKSTQVPKYLYEAGYTDNGIIACLHPRCVAAITLANRVSHELNTETGGLVGFHVRFFNVKSGATKILFMTTGLMLQTIKYENILPKYSVIIIDEAHERSVLADVMMGEVKEMLKTSDKIKVVIMSATLNMQQIQDYYSGCPLINISKTKDQTEVIYRPPKSNDYIGEIKVIVEEILRTSQKGHILIFLPGEDKIWKCRESLKNLKLTRTLPFFSSMDETEKHHVFEEFRGRRKIIIATNVAETSLTIPGVDFVIDSGLVKRFTYDHETGVDQFQTKWISIAEADQRKGRTGRTGRGTCYRLYSPECVIPLKSKKASTTISNMTVKTDVTETNPFPPRPLSEERISYQSYMDWMNKNVERFLNLDDDDLLEENFNLFRVPNDGRNPYVPFDTFPEPEIHLTNLTSMILMLKSMNHLDINQFPFLCPPDAQKLKLATISLKILSMLDDNGRLTKAGNSVSRLPLDPQLGKVVFNGCTLPCRNDVLAIAAMLSVRSVLKRKMTYENFACCLPNQSRSANGFATVAITTNHGDLFKLRNIFFEARANRFARFWCQENQINYSCIKYVNRVYEQLLYVTEPLILNNNKRLDHASFLRRNSENLVKKCFLSGYFTNVAVRMDSLTTLTMGKDSHTIENGTEKVGSNGAEVVVVYNDGDCVVDDKRGSTNGTEKNKNKNKDKKEKDKNDEDGEAKYHKLDLEKPLYTAKLSSLYRSDEEIIMFHSLQKRSERADTLTMNYCTSLNRNMLKDLKPKSYGIKASSWNKVLAHLNNVSN